MNLLKQYHICIKLFVVYKCLTIYLRFIYYKDMVHHVEELRQFFKYSNSKHVHQALECEAFTVFALISHLLDMTNFITIHETTDLVTGLHHLTIKDQLNSLWPRDVIGCHRSRSTLAQVMTWSSYSTKPLPEPMLTDHQRGLVAFTLLQFHRKHVYPWWVWKLLIEEYNHIYQGPLN